MAVLLHVPVALLLVRATSGRHVNEAICVVLLLLVTFTVLPTRHADGAASDRSWHAERLLSPDRAAMTGRVICSAVALLIVAILAHLSARTLAVRRGHLIDDAPRPACVTFYRAAMMLATCIAILAVDFPIFPRRFAKTETFGVSLMDLGVGGFVFSMALVSPAARGSSVPLARALGSVLPLLVLGGARLVMTRGASLDAHVSEYGVHWNFFMTLATVALAVALLRVRVELGALLGAALLVVYQVALSAGGLTEYILEHPRTNLLHANKEGLCSWIGYVAIYLIGAWCGRELLQAQPTTRWATLRRAALWTAAFWLAALAASALVQEPSRRMANAAYVLLTVAINMHTVLLCAVVTYVTPAVPLPLVDAVNENQLAVFLVANLATGAVNLSMRAREQSNAVALAVLVVYMLLVCGAAVGMQRAGFKLKI